MNIAQELEKHASEELDHAIKIANQIDYFGGMPTATAKPVKLSEDAVEMLRADLENERITIANYRTRVRQADAMGEFALSEILRKILVQEQEHLMDLATALGIDPPIRRGKVTLRCPQFNIRPLFRSFQRSLSRWRNFRASDFSLHIP